MNLNTNFSFDIDGTISDYPDYWLKFLLHLTGEEFASTFDAKSRLGLDLYDKYKTEWRLGPGKYEIPIHREILELADAIYDAGGRVFINSQRPFHKFPQMREKTINWLRLNKFQFEDVGPKSLAALTSQQISYHIDDEIAEALRLKSVPTVIKVILICKDDAEFRHKSLETENDSMIIPFQLGKLSDVFSGWQSKHH